MGHIIESVALERGHEVVCVIDKDNQGDFESLAFASADVAIEFTMPQMASVNILRAWESGVPVVCGTTGWNVEAMKQEAMKQTLKASTTSLFGSSVTTLFGFLALCFMQLGIGFNIGIIMAKGVVIGVLAAILILPAYLLVFDNKIRIFRDSQRRDTHCLHGNLR